MPKTRDERAIYVSSICKSRRLATRQWYVPVFTSGVLTDVSPPPTNRSTSWLVLFTMSIFRIQFALGHNSSSLVGDHHYRLTVVPLFITRPLIRARFYARYSVLKYLNIRNVPCNNWRHVIFARAWLLLIVLAVFRVFWFHLPSYF